MQNVTIKPNGSKIVIEIDTSAKSIKDARPSSTGKTRLLATTGAAQPVDCNIAGLKVALNVTIPAT